VCCCCDAVGLSSVHSLSRDCKCASDNTSALLQKITPQHRTSWWRCCYTTCYRLSLSHYPLFVYALFALAARCESSAVSHCSLSSTPHLLIEYEYCDCSQACVNRERPLLPTPSPFSGAVIGGLVLQNSDMLITLACGLLLLLLLLLVSSAPLQSKCCV
jgi:hypothetical protein